MEYVYGAMLLHSAGKEITEENLKKVMTSTGVKVEEAKVKAIVSALDGVNIEEAIKSVPVVSAPAAAAPAAGSAEVSSEASEEKAAEEDQKSEEAAASGLSSLFG